MIAVNSLIASFLCIAPPSLPQQPEVFKDWAGLTPTHLLTTQSPPLIFFSSTASLNPLISQV